MKRIVRVCVRTANDPGKRWMVLICVIMTVAVGIRVIMAFTVGEIDGPDWGQYHKGALALLEGKGFKNVHTDPGPLYRMFIAVIYRLFGVHNGLSVQLVQCVCWGAAVGLIGLIGRRVFDSSVGLGAAAFAAVYPPFIKYRFFGGSTYYATENLYIWLLLVMMWCLVAEERPTVRRIGLAGATLGLATLTRGTSLLFPFVVAVWWLWRRPFEGRQWVRDVLAFCLGRWVVILPWAIRNYFVYRAVVPVSPAAGLPLFGGNNPYSGGNWVDSSGAREYRWIREINDPVERNRAYIKTVIKFWRDSTPVDLLKLAVKKTFLFWTDYSNAYNLFYGLMVPFSWLGMWLSRRNTRALILCGIVLYTLSFCLVVYATERMRLPIEPYLILLASAGVVWLVRRFQRKLIPIALLAGWVCLHLIIARIWATLSRLINVV